MSADYKKLPFKEGIDFFQQKVNLPTQAWTDIWEGMHSRAFVVAGAMRDELLTDFRRSIDKALAAGTSLDDFRKDFDRIVAKHGWDYNGGQGWRSKVIFETNIQQAYNTGREQQIQDPELRKARPYGLYRHGDSAEPRPGHIANDGKVIPLDDPWWEVWTPQNGWGCKCKKFSISADEARRRGYSILESGPEIEWEEVVVGKNGPTPRTIKTPVGIDPGFGYNPGTTAWGKLLSDDVWAQWQELPRSERFESLTPGNWQSAGRPATVPLDALSSPLLTPAKTQDEVVSQLKSVLGADEQVFDVGGVPVLVNAASLGSHLDKRRSEFLPSVIDILNDPFEVWAAFEKHRGSGKVMLRQRVVSAVDVNGGRAICIVLNARNGMIEALTFIPSSKMKELNKWRRGELIYERK